VVPFVFQFESSCRSSYLLYSDLAKFLQNFIASGIDTGANSIFQTKNWHQSKGEYDGMANEVSGLSTESEMAANSRGSQE
jgi:hypothetical protein